MKHDKSEALFARAQAVIPGGVNSPVRAFRSVGGIPRFIARGKGSRIFDVDGNDYIDYVGSWGPLLLGHRPPSGDRRRFGRPSKIGTSFGAPTEREVELAELITRLRAIDGDGAPGELRHRGDDERAAAGARVHGARPDREVRGLLPRPRRFAAGEGRLGHGDAWELPTRGRSAGVRGDDHRAAVQFDRRGGEGISPSTAKDRCRDRRAGGGQHGLRAARAGIPARLCAN